MNIEIVWNKQKLAEKAWNLKCIDGAPVIFILIIAGPPVHIW